MNDETHMRVALEEARLAAADGEVPIGAVVVCDGAVVARAHNRRENDRDPTAHAELLAIRSAAQGLGRWRLSGCTVYVTLEPCPMCAGAMHQARIDRLVFGALDPKAGAVGSLYDLSDDRRLNHRFDVTSGVLADESSALLRAFFARLRSEGGDFGRGEE
jgi:tRNA(adenine34) deaminase